MNQIHETALDCLQLAITLVVVLSFSAGIWLWVGA